MIRWWPRVLRPQTFLQVVAILGAIAGVLAVIGVVSYRAHGMEGLLALLIAAPFAAAFAAPSLVELFPSYWRWVDERTFEPWQGRYYAFDDRQVRIAEARGELWFASADVHAALALPLRAHLLAGFDARERFLHPEVGDALSITGLRRLLGKRSDPTTLRFLRWAEHDVRRPWSRRRERDACASNPSPHVPS